MKIATAFVEVRPDTRRFREDLDRDASQAARSAASTMANVLGGAAFLAGAGKAINAASELEQAVGGTAAVFKESSAEIDAWAKNAAQSAGLSERAARELTAQLGGLLKGFDFTTDEAAALSIQLSQLGADLAATFGGKPEDAVQALGAALRGEFNPIERYGIALNVTQANLKAVEMGLAESTSQVDLNARAQAALQIIMERSADAQGQFAREAQTAAGAQAIAAAEAENAAADLGENMLPVYTRMVEVAGMVARAFGALPEPLQTAGIALAGIAVAARPVRAAVELTTAALRVLPRALDRVAVGAYDAAGNMGRLKGALGALGFAAVIAGAVQMARSMNRVNVDVDALAAATANLTDEQERQIQQALLAAHSIGKLDDIIAQTTSTNVKAAERLLEQAEAAGVTGDELDRLRRIIDDKRAADAQGARDQADYADEMDAAAGASRTLASAVDDQATALERAKTALDKFKEGMEDAFAPLGVEEAVDRRAAALNDLAQGIEDRARAVDDARRRVAELQAMRVDERPDDWAHRLQEAQRDLEEAVAATSLALDDNTEAGLRNRRQIRDLIEDVGDIIAARRDEGASLEELRTIRDLEIANLRTQLEQMGYNRAEIDRYVQVIEDIPLTKATTITVDTAEAELKVKRLLGLMDEATVGAGAALQAETQLRRHQVTKRALGGSVPDGLFTVGEYGTAELLRKEGSRVDVIAGATPTPLGADLGALEGVNEAQLLVLREMAAVLAGLASSGETGMQRLRAMRAGI